MEDSILVSKVTLPTGKIVYLKDATMGHIEKATQIAGSLGKENQAYVSMLMSKELMKTLIVQINDKRLTMSDKEQINQLLSIKEYRALAKFVADLTGLSEDSGNLQVEQETFGEKSLG